ncbi:F-box/kelch-repeat protein At1g15670-like [Zingiber officinale]|nr:F-box/kelch-repeat protein At1g15670-like [Zingiber officinale]
MKRSRRSVPAMNRSRRFVWALKRSRRSIPAMKRSRRSVPAMKPSRARRIMTVEAELIPELPDCLALECLLRLPFHAILDARAVCKRWKEELDSPSFYRIRKADGLASRVVSLLLRGKLRRTVGKFHLALYEPDTGVCTMRQLAPDRPNLKMGSIAGIVGRELVVMKKRRTGEVHFYDLLSGAWRPGAPNPAPQRSLSRNVFRGDKLFVIGGRDGGGKKLRSALVYDAPADTWIKIPDLEGLGSLLDGSFYTRFWKSKEEYFSGIQCCREQLLLGDGEDDLIFYPTEGGREIVFPEENLILNENALANLRKHLGILPNELGRYLEYFHSGRL